MSTRNLADVCLRPKLSGIGRPLHHGASHFNA
jgi:hypothetical protein